MADKETMANQVLFGGRNMVENVNFIPAEKWDWKPAPGAKSAHEVFTHMLKNFALFNAQFGGGEYVEAEGIDANKAALLQGCEDYAANLRGASDEKMAEKLKLGQMEVPIGSFAAMAAVDIFHHHGQIAYLQTMWDDQDSHFDMSAFGLLS